MTRPEDAHLAAEAGADAIGMVFYPAAKRCISNDTAESILAKLPAFVTAVGLFVDEQSSVVLEKARQLNLTHVQLHGRETPGQVEALHGLKVIKALRVDPKTFCDDLDRWRRALQSGRIDLAGIVLETAGTAHAGGTGVENNWCAIRTFQSEGMFDGLPPIIAAGGLASGNVGRVVTDIRPWAVDVSTGVEETFGQKSVEKVAAFVRAVADADNAA